MKPALLEILLLGPVEIKSGEELFNINRRMERAILYILAVENKPVSRTRLIDFLWPDAEQSDPRAALRTALSRLRNELPDPELLQTELDQVWLDFDRCFVDVKAFEDQYQHLKHLLSAYQNNRSLPTSIVNRIEKALDLWRGNIILSGDNLSKYHAIDIWRQSINNKLNHRRKFLMKRLAEHYRILGQDERALSNFIELAKIDFSDVASQCAALDILISMGRLQDAINFCDTLENVYELEFNAPLPNEILSRCQRYEYQINRDQNDEQYQWPIPLTMNLPLIGRQTELYQLHQAFVKGGWVSIQGEMGIGKTRLVQELFQTLSQKPILVLIFCREMENSLPFSPVINCLRNYVPADIWKEIDPIWIKQISLLVPELTDYLNGDNQAPISRLPAGKQHLFDALLNVCQHISKKYGKILFFLDNAHWADNQTLLAISYLITHDFFEKHGLLVISSRPEEIHPDLDIWIEQLPQTKTNQLIHLSSLNYYELKNLAAQVLEQPPSEEFINKLMQETSGNPFLALEIIRNILDTTSSPDKLGKLSTLPLPMSIRVLLRKRLLSLDEQSRHLLLCAAALGDNLSLDLLETVAELTPSTISMAIDPLIKSGFIQTSSKNEDNENHLHFSNEIMREVVLKEASNFHLQILHRQVARRMASNSQYEDKATMIANHFLLGGDKKRAFDWSLKAAEHAWLLGSQEDAQQSYQQAEKLTRNGSESLFTQEDVIKLYRQWSDFAYESHQIELVEKLGAQLQYMGGRENHPLVIGTSQIILSDACFLRLDFETGLTLIQEGIENLEIAGDYEALIKAIKRKGVISWWTMDYDQVEISANRVLALIQETELNDGLKTSLEFNAKHLINMMHYTHGQASLALQTAQRLYTAYLHKLEPFDRLRSLYLIGYASLIAAEYEMCEYHIKKGLEIARPLGNNLLEEVLLIILGKSELIQGKLDQSYQHLTLALKSAEAANRKQNIISANCALGDLFYMLNNSTGALQHYRIAQIRDGFSSHSFYGIENNIHLAHYLSSVNQKEEAQKILEHNLPPAKKYDLGKFYIQGLLASGGLKQNEGDLLAAEKIFSEAIKIAEERDLFHDLALAKITYAKLLMAKNESYEAKTYMDEVLEISQKKNMIWVHLYTLTLSIIFLKERNDLVKLMKHKLAFNKIIENLSVKIKIEPIKSLFHQAVEDWKKNF